MPWGTAALPALRLEQATTAATRGVQLDHVAALHFHAGLRRYVLGGTVNTQHTVDTRRTRPCTMQRMRWMNTPVGQHADGHVF